jgi:fructose-1,6-bisphosphatase/inositol monophosphatase family enzyme
MFVTTSPDYFDQQGCRLLYDDLVRQSRISRGFPDAYALAMVITGRADFCVEPTVKKWDVCAAEALVRGAGGELHDMAGNALWAHESAVVSNGILQESILTITKPVCVTN